MKNHNGRVLAYNLAKEIAVEDLAKVAGGHGHATFASTQTPSGPCTDGYMDMSWDQ